MVSPPEIGIWDEAVTYVLLEYRRWSLLECLLFVKNPTVYCSAGVLQYNYDDVNENLQFRT